MPRTMSNRCRKTSRGRYHPNWSYSPHRVMERIRQLWLLHAQVGVRKRPPVAREHRGIQLLGEVPGSRMWSRKNARVSSKVRKAIETENRVVSGTGHTRSSHRIQKRLAGFHLAREEVTTLVNQSGVMESNGRSVLEIDAALSGRYVVSFVKRNRSRERAL